MISHFCIDCKFMALPEGCSTDNAQDHALCCRPIEQDIITGEIKKYAQFDARNERMLGQCGRDAKFFVKKFGG